MGDKYAVLYNDGNLKAQDFQFECKKEGWIPILVLRDNEDKITVPMFRNRKIAHNFMKRNSPENSGLIVLIDEDIHQMENNEWSVEYFTFPRRFTNHPEYTIDLEIIEIENLGFQTYRSNQKL